MTEKFADRIKVPSGLWLGLQNMGVSAADLLRQAQLPLAVFTHQGPINTRQYFALWQAMFDVTGDSAIGIKLPAFLPAEKLPPSLIDAYHARDFRDALQRMARYKRLCVPEHLELQEEGDLCRVEFSWLFADPELDLTEVALLLGYEDQSSFFRAFKIWEGVTPATWRGKV
ncbi:MAG: AraC family transcriptional regulator [Ewingella americana]|jgi:hypothetical protein|uniref:AraC family transcriptional regulator n=1 Tax=Ewingella americana TaxID=41202 RepID=UPI002430116D|nr:AraC family transcriptional regulator [Ewingella americana]MCI1678498.1 AraC family transcriptional regulator [Ewingella americana]MCI1854085.1 AraC family transcriptional regulator [Ewingella americana]MCI1861385.1 AraC family transcriptional regulator [Ewingella americana]MCI2143502.1 AraC family transcriptional regulator [Ewingella americana]MCI2163632.1 AraC family transcriptional regulator [Ewingella americana]